MAEDDNYSIKEVLDLSIRNMKNVTDEIREHLTSQDVVLDDIKKTAKATDEKIGIQNGRVRKLEDWSNDVKVILEANTRDIKNLDRYKYWIIGVGATFLITGYFALQSIVKTTVDNEFTQRVNNVTIAP